MTPIPLLPYGRDKRRPAPFEPVIARGATSDFSPYELDIIDKQVALPERPVARQVERGGVLGTLGHIGKGLLTGLAMGGEQGVGQAIGAGLAGGIAGGVSPQAAENLRFETFILPKYEKEKLQAQKDIAFQQSIIDDIAKRTGVDPRTGMPTIAAQEYQSQKQAREAQIANIAADNERLAKQDEANRQRQAQEDTYKRTKDVADQRGDLSKQGAEFTASPSELFFGHHIVNRGNIVPSVDNKGFYRLPSTKQEQDRKLELERAKGEADLGLALKKDEITRPREVETYRKKKEIDSEYDTKTDKQAQQDYDKALALHNDVQKAINAARTIREKTGSDDESAWENARDLANAARQAYPDLIEVGGLESGEYPYVKMKGNRPAPTAKSKPSSSKTQKTISAADFDEVVRDSFGGDRAKAMAEAQRRGWTIQ